MQIKIQKNKNLKLMFYLGAKLTKLWSGIQNYVRFCQNLQNFHCQMCLVALKMVFHNMSYGSFQPAFTYLKLTIETLEQSVKYVQSQQERHQNKNNGVVLVSLLLTLNIFHTLF